MTTKLTEKLKNLKYRAERFFNGESGIVERVESTQDSLDFNLQTQSFPDKITFRNPLGELVTVLTPVSELYTRDGVHYFHIRYQPGNKFPYNYP